MLVASVFRGHDCMFSNLFPRTFFGVKQRRERELFRLPPITPVARIKTVVLKASSLALIIQFNHTAKVAWCKL